MLQKIQGRVASLILMPLCFMGAFTPTEIWADEAGDDGAIFGDRFQIQGDLPIDLIMREDPNGDMEDNLRLKGFEIQLTGKISENIKAVIRTRLDRVLRQNGQDAKSQFDVEDFIKDAYIKITNIGGQPVAFVVGKHKIAFGQNFTEMPITHENPLEGALKQQDVIGFTVALNYNLFELIDTVEFSGFETEAGDLDIGEFDGAALRLSKSINDKIKAQMSYMHKGNGHSDTLEQEDRVSVGMVYQDGAWTAWIEGVYLRNHPKYQQADLAITGGLAYTRGPGTVAVESTYIQHSLTQLGIGYKLFITKDLTFGPEVRYTMYEGGSQKDALAVGARIVYTFGDSKKYRKRYLFGPEEKKENK